MNKIGFKYNIQEQKKEKNNNKLFTILIAIILALFVLYITMQTL